MPTIFSSLDEFADFWRTPKPRHPESELILNVFTMGLGGPEPSNELFHFLQMNCKNYKKVYVFAFGTSRPHEVQTDKMLELIESIDGCAVETYYYPGDVPGSSLETQPPETVTHMFETQFDGVSYDYYRSVPPFVFYDRNGLRLLKEDEILIERQRIGKIMRHWGDFFKNVKNGILAIDNNAFIRTSGYLTNLNFEYMDWIPRTLQINRSTGRIFQLKHSGGAAILEPFFSEEAVYKWSPDMLYKMLFFNTFIPHGLEETVQANTIHARISDAEKRRRLLLIYTCKRDNPDSASLPDFSTHTCPAAAATGAAAAAGGAGTVGGKRRKTRHQQRRNKRAISKRQSRRRN